MEREIIEMCGSNVAVEFDIFYCNFSGGTNNYLPRSYMITFHSECQNHYLCEKKTI